MVVCRTKDNVLRFIGKDLYEIISEKIGQDFENLEEIRLRIGNPVILKFNSGEKIINKIVSKSAIRETLQLICENSIYAYQSEINKGFITIKGGHRVRNLWRLCDRKWESYKYFIYL
jgi:stage III sporulation protein AA